MSSALTREEHEEKAARNETFAATVLGLGEQHLDWVVTGYFYAALHRVEAYFHARGQGFASHARRNQEVSARFPSTERDRYLMLYYYSLLARYDSVSVDRSVHDDAVQRQYHPLRAWLTAQL